LITRAINGDMPTDEEWRDASAAAYAAADAAFYTAKAAYSDAYYAAYAADDAADYVRYDAMKDYVRCYMKLLRELK
jgi:hypothetical protein